ncbi:hypothetical protein [Bacillus massiliigorillae]|nr:hypothetical protein [Bacillus massiliigorillae]
MKEFVGNCTLCQKEINCLEGFLNGVINEKDGRLYCFECDAESTEN